MLERKNKRIQYKNTLLHGMIQWQWWRIALTPRNKRISDTISKRGVLDGKTIWLSSKQTNWKIKFTQGYAGTVQALDTTWYNRHEQSEQEYKHLASTVIDEETGRQLEYRHLTQHLKFKDDWLKSGANKLYRLFQGSKQETDETQQIKGMNTLFWINKSQLPKNKTATIIG